MVNTPAVFQLIHSLSKSEKRYFKLFTSLQGGMKDYHHLFDLMEKESNFEMVRKQFAARKNDAAFEATCKYLYKVLTDSLIQGRMETDKTTRILNTLMKARVLFEKSLYEEGLALIEKAKKDAAESEEFLIQLWASQTELYYLSNLNFHTIDEKELVEKQMKIAELLKYQKNIHQHTSLYELLRHRLMYSGEVRTQEQKIRLNDLVVSELNYNSNPLADTFESEKIHLLFQSYYFITINDPKSALKTFFELNDLLDKNKNLWIERPVDYLSTIEGILESLLLVKRYKEIGLFLEKLQHISINSVYFKVMVERVRFIYTCASLIHAGEFAELSSVRKQFEGELFRKIHLLDLSKRAEIHLFDAIIHIGLGNMNQAHKELNKVLLESKLFYSLPSYRTFRLLHLLIHYELKNFDYIDYEIRSLKRTLKSESGKSFKIEKIIFRFFQKRHLPVSYKARELEWKGFEKAFKKCETDVYEMHLMRIFDFGSWVQARIMRMSFSEVLKSKHAVPL